MCNRILGAMALCGVLACATEKQAWSEALPVQVEVLLEVLPPEAAVILDGAVVGAGTTTLKLGAAPATVQVTADGFEALQVTLDPKLHAGARVGMVLRPSGYGEGRPLAIDDANGLAAASGWLLRAGRVADATAYAERAVQASPAAPAPRRALGLALAKQGKRGRAAQELSQYLQLAPGAADRAEIEAAVERFRGDISIPPRGY
ncbi:MAG: tetratricopeptide repeat protein [Deltaproteobacteria bacterium]|nr:tetratricopeptide repeat protein [Deltaproteobacteria bacterium]